MSKFKQMAIAVNVKRIQEMLDGRKMDVCPVNDLQSALKCERRHEDLRSIHCMKWSELPDNAKILVVEEISACYGAEMEECGVSFFTEPQFGSRKDCDIKLLGGVT